MIGGMRVAFLEFCVDGGPGHMPTRRVQITVRTEVRSDAVTQTGCGFREPEHIHVGRPYGVTNQVGESIGGVGDEIRIDWYVLTEDLGHEKVCTPRISA